MSNGQGKGGDQSRLVEGLVMHSSGGDAAVLRWWGRLEVLSCGAVRKWPAEPRNRLNKKGSASSRRGESNSSPLPPSNTETTVSYSLGDGVMAPLQWAGDCSWTITMTFLNQTKGELFHNPPAMIKERASSPAHASFTC